MNSCLICEQPTTGKFCSYGCRSSARWNKVASEIREKRSGEGFGVRSVKRVLIEDRGRKCEICGITEWLAKPLVVIMDHIDGNSGNWTFDNLRLICSNCDTTLPTYKSRNKGNGRFARRERYAEGCSF